MKQRKKFLKCQTYIGKKNQQETHDTNSGRIPIKEYKTYEVPNLKIRNKYWD